MTTQHTPTPWQAPETMSFYILGASELGQFVANASTKANAEFIVRACNAHDELVAALQAMVDAMGTAGNGKTAKALLAARAAIARVSK